MSYPKSPHGQQSPFSMKQISYYKQINRFGATDGQGTVTLWYKDRHTLLLECFLTFLRCIIMRSEGPLIAYMIRIWSTQHLFYKIYSQISSKIANLGYHISPGNMTLCSNNWHPLLLECFISSIRCIRMRLEEPLNAYMIPLWSTQHLFYKIYSQISSKIANLGHQISLKSVILWCRDTQPLLIQCFINSLDVNIWFEEPLKA